MGKSLIRLIVPDSHGAHIDQAARAAFLRDAKALRPDQIVWLGDHLDCGGVFSVHQRSYTNEMCEAYEDDVGAGNSLLDEAAEAAPRAEQHYLFGNHEQHVERWAARAFTRRRDAESLLAEWGPAKRLRLRDRGIRFYKQGEHYMGLSIPGTIKLGKCFFTHGIAHGMRATHVHLIRFGHSVVHGHNHTAASIVERTVTSDGHGAWCPGTLAKLQPLYRHTTPTSWTHGYGLQFVAPSGRFVHINVPILKGQSDLLALVNAIGRRATRRRAA